MLLWHSRLLLKDGLTGNPISVDVHDREFLAQIDSALRLSPLHAVAAYASFHALANEKLQKGNFPLIVEGKSLTVSVEEPERVLVDEICTSAKDGMASMRTRDLVVNLLPSGLEYLSLVDTTVGEGKASTAAASVSTRRVQSSHRCEGTTKENRQCGNITLLMYRLDATHPWKSLCWRHKQQIFAVVPASKADSKT